MILIAPTGGLVAGDDDGYGYDGDDLEVAFELKSTTTRTTMN